MFDEQLTELRNSITAALIEEPLKVASQAIDDAFDDAFGTGGSDSELRHLIDRYCPFYERVGFWVRGYWRIHVSWHAMFAGSIVYPEVYDFGDDDNAMTLYGWIRRESRGAIYIAISRLVDVDYQFRKCDLEQDQLDGYEAALNRLRALWD